MESDSLSSAALHAARGVLSTPKRLREFIAAAGLPKDSSLNAPQLESMLVPVPGITSVSELARTMCRDCALSQNLLDQAQTVFSEIKQPYPSAFDPLIKQLIDQFNKIDERSEIQELQQYAFQTARSSADGLTLARRIGTAIDRTRAKDLVGCRIAMLTTLFDQSLASAQQRHRDISGANPAAFRTAVCKMYSSEGGQIPKFTDAEQAELSKQFGYPAQSTELYDSLRLHLEDAVATMHVERDMQ
jgi:hypothetical protein